MATHRSSSSSAVSPPATGSTSNEFPTLAVYGRTDGPELRVITCGGDLDADGHHLDNTVVFARLVQN